MRPQDHLGKVQEYLTARERAPVETVKLLQQAVDHLEQINDSLAILTDWTEVIEKRLPRQGPRRLG